MSYTYNAEDTRIRAINGDTEPLYTFDTAARLSKLLTKTENGVITKYVYGLGLIGEETANSFTTYHFDYRGSTVAVTDSTGFVLDTYQYDTYGKLISGGNSFATPFLYNGRDGVITEPNGLCYMRARYYSPVLKRFINADIVAGSLSDAITLNRYAYANGNPVSNIDPFGLSAEHGSIDIQKYTYSLEEILQLALKSLAESSSITFGTNISLYSDPIYTMTYLSDYTLGSGEFNLKHTFSNQLELLANYTFPTSISKENITVSTNKSISIEYSQKLNKYNDISWAISFNTNEIECSYSIRTADLYGNSMTTGISVSQNISSSKSSKPSFGDVLNEWLVTAGLFALVALALIDTVGTYGAGVWNDLPAIVAFLHKLSEAASATKLALT